VGRALQRWPQAANGTRGEIGGQDQSSCVCLQAGLYNPSILPTLKTQPEKSAFLQHSQDIPLCPHPLFPMATVGLNYVQFWAPPSNPFLYKQHTTSSQSKGSSICTNSSRDQLALLHNKADRIFKCNDQSKSEYYSV
jgi:hypothetical protein